MLQSDSTMLVVGEGVNAPQRTPCFTSRSISELKLMCFVQKWLIEVRPCEPGKSRSLSGRWERLHFSNLHIHAIRF